MSITALLVQAEVERDAAIARAEAAEAAERHQHSERMAERARAEAAEAKVAEQDALYLAGYSAALERETDAVMRAEAAEAKVERLRIAVERERAWAVDYREQRDAAEAKLAAVEALCIERGDHEPTEWVHMSAIRAALATEADDNIGPDGETLGLPDPAHGTLDESVPVVTETP